MERKMIRLATASALAAIGLSVAGCGPINRGLESVNQPIVSRSDYVFDASAAGLSSTDAAEAARVSAWFDSIGLRYGDRVSIDESAAYAGSSREVVAALAAKRGLIIEEAAPVTTGAITPGAIRVVVSRTAANVPDCPNWDRGSQPEFASSTMSNYGCATNSNLAAMIANPEDLVHGRSSDGTDTRVTTKAIKTYRDATPTGSGGLDQVSTKGGN